MALIVGIFQIRLQTFNKVNVVVMKSSIVKTNKNHKLKIKFDLKGSLINRFSLSET